MKTGPAVFWSYAHDDDQFDGGRILRLAEDLRSELGLLSTDPPRIFVDRDSVEWGDEWRSIINNALVEAPLLVSIITPKYFTRAECRRELLTFHAGSKTAGDEFVLPILYINVDELTEENPDEAYAIVAGTQFFDFRELRLTALDSVEYRRAVNSLSKRILALIESMIERRLVVETEEASGNAADDLEALLVEADALWPDWINTVESDEVLNKQRIAIDDIYAERRRRLRLARARTTTIMDAYTKQARDSMPLVEKHLEDAEKYSKRTIELNPVVSACIRAGRENPGLAGVLTELLEKVDEGVRRILQGELFAREHNLISVDEFVRGMPYVSQTWRRIQDVENRTEKLVTEANEVVLGWAEELRGVLAEGVGGAGSPDLRGATAALAAGDRRTREAQGLDLN